MGVNENNGSAAVVGMAFAALSGFVVGVSFTMISLNVIGYLCF
jgi:hypothetical protein